MSKKVYFDEDPNSARTFAAIAVVIICLTAFIYMYSIAASLDYSQNAKDIERYCEMTKLYSDTNGLRGWPDYSGDAKDICGPDH